ncbi:MAG: hypothetical protein ACOCVZ_00415 [Gemmatimonadota bacterium]
MGETRSSWTRPAAPVLLLVLILGLVAARPAPVEAQDELSEVCDAASARSECYLAAGAVRLIHPRVGLGLFGGSPVPGTASTLGMRLGELPRFSVSGRLVVLPIEVPPLVDRGRARGDGGVVAGISGQTTVGILTGFSPLPTVGGVLSLDAIGRVSLLALPGDDFEDDGVLGLSAGLRLGLLRESFTLPGVSLTASYGRSGSVAVGGIGDDGYIEGSVANWNATAAATKRTGPVGVTGGVSFDRYTGTVDYAYPGAAGPATADATTDRWSAFGNVSWTFLIFHAVLEAGWQQSPVPENLPTDVTVDPAGWWGGVAFRVSI